MGSLVKRALVIGGTGFIGLHVVDALLGAGWSVRTTRRKSSPTLLLRKRPVEMVNGSLDDAESLRRAMEGIDVVFLTAGHYPRYSLTPDASVALAVGQLDRCYAAAKDAQVRRVVYASSVAALAPGETPATEDDVGPPDLREGTYPTVKKAMEAATDRARDGGLDVTSLLLGGCIGPWDLRLGTNGFLAAILSGAVPHWYDGLVHLVAVEDAAHAHLAAALSGGPRHLVGGHTVRVGELIGGLVRRHGAPDPGPSISLDEMRALAEAAERAAAPLRLRVPVPRELVDIAALGRPIDSRRALESLGLSLTPLDAAIDATVAWLVRHRFVRSAPSPARILDAKPHLDS